MTGWEYPDIGKLASLARTALDDPLALDPALYEEKAPREYAIARLDEIIGAVEPDRDPRVVLTVAGRIIAGVADRFTGLEQDTDTVMLGDELHKALDLVDEVIAELTPWARIEEER